MRALWDELERGSVTPLAEEHFARTIDWLRAVPVKGRAERYALLDAQGRDQPGRRPVFSNRVEPELVHEVATFSQGAGDWEQYREGRAAHFRISVSPKPDDYARDVDPRVAGAMQDAIRTQRQQLHAAVANGECSTGSTRPTGP